MLNCKTVCAHFQKFLWEKPLRIKSRVERIKMSVIVFSSQKKIKEPAVTETELFWMLLLCVVSFPPFFLLTLLFIIHSKINLSFFFNSECLSWKPVWLNNRGSFSCACEVITWRQAHPHSNAKELCARINIRMLLLYITDSSDAPSTLQESPTRFPPTLPKSKAEDASTKEKNIKSKAYIEEKHCPELRWSGTYIVIFRIKESEFICSLNPLTQNLKKKVSM